MSEPQNPAQKRPMDTVIFHICPLERWEKALACGEHVGNPQDLQDGFIHFSTAAQIEESAAKHRAGETGLLLIAVDSLSLGDALRWEESRRGLLFPHLYSTLSLKAVLATHPLPLGQDGMHCFPDLYDLKGW